VADSERSQIVDGVLSALAVVSTLHVSETLIHWEEVPKQYYPIAAYVTDHNENWEAWSLFGGTAHDDVKATLMLTVTCYCYRSDNSGRELRRLRTDLIRDVSAALEAGTTLMSLALDLRPMRVVSDQGVIKNYSIFDYEFEVDYLYEHATGG
jgi:hypothetical protein